MGTNPAKGADLPEFIRSEAELDELLSRPSPALVRFIKTLPSPLVILGAGGKMGPTLVRTACRAAEAARHRLEVIAVSRFSDAGARESVERCGARTLSCDLLEPKAFRRLPDAENVISLVGLKFGTAQNPAATWAINTVVPALVSQRYPQARMVALSTGNVYPPAPIAGGGSVESDALTPVGEYANSAVARERVFEFYSLRQRTPLALLRLFYAVELRYGVLVDIARKISAGEPVELATARFNCIWQGDANDLILRALSLAGCPPTAWNLCHPEILTVRAVGTRVGELLGRKPGFVGRPAATALLGNPARVCAALGPPSMPLDRVLAWTAQWVKAGGRSLDKPTHFEVRDGRY